MGMQKTTTKKVVIITFISVIVIGIILGLNSFRKSTMQETLNQMYLARGTPASYATAVKKSAPAVVSLQTTDSETLHQGLGSGVIVDTNGYILTNHHVIKNASEIIAKLADGRHSTARVVGIDPPTDLAVLQIELVNLQAIHLGTSGNIQVGDVVLAIGNPYGLNSTVTQGIVSAVGSIQDISFAPQEYRELIGDLIQTDAAINLGNSGGALIDAYGNMVGINTAIISSVTGSQGIGFAIPVDKAKTVMQQIINNGNVTRGWIGTQLSNLPAETKKYLQFHGQDGIYVQDTMRNSPAQIAGILPGDIITRVNNYKTQDILKTISLISALTPGKSCEVEIFRNGEKIIFPVTVKQRPNTES